MRVTIRTLVEGSVLCIVTFILLSPLSDAILYLLRALLLQNTGLFSKIWQLTMLHLSTSCMGSRQGRRRSTVPGPSKKPHESFASKGGAETISCSIFIPSVQGWTCPQLEFNPSLYVCMLAKPGQGQAACISKKKIFKKNSPGHRAIHQT